MGSGNAARAGGISDPRLRALTGSTACARSANPGKAVEVWAEDEARLKQQHQGLNDKNANLQKQINEYDQKKQQLEKQLEEVVAALDRIEKGTYGIDPETGIAIDRARLEANPSARNSIAKPPTKKGKKK